MKLRHYLSFGLMVSFLTLFFTTLPVDASDSKYVRWSKSQFPLKVYVQTSSSIPGFKKSYPVAVTQAFAQWKKNSNGLVDFVITNNPNNADIQVNWTNTIKKDQLSDQAKGHSFAWGTTELGYPTKINLAIKHPMNTSENLSNNIIYMISLHEIGHALGLWWHSKNKNDIMFSNFIVPSTSVNGSRMVVNKNKGNLSIRDIQNLIALYNNNRVVLIDKKARGSKISMPSYNNSELGQIETTGVAAASVGTQTKNHDLNFGESLRQVNENPNSAPAHNNLGLLYMEKKDYNNAIKYLEKAVSLDPLSASSHFNLALAYNKVQNYPLAIKEYNLYLKINPNADNSDKVKQELLRLKTL